MSRESDEALKKKIHKEYAEYLDREGIPYTNGNNGFDVHIPLQNIKESFTQICDPYDGRVLLDDYCGNCYTGVRAANRVAKAIRAQCPGYEITVEHYGASFEIVVCYLCEYTTAEAFHEYVLGVAHAADVGAGIGKEMLGDSFKR